MQERTLSSDWTLWAKFIFPVVWIVGFGLGSAALWLGAAKDIVPPLLGLFAAWIAGTAFILWANVGLKRIRADDHQLHVSNYLREISVPFNAIADVKQNRWLNFRPVTIYFRDSTEFGDKATFMPKRQFRLQFWRTDPVVNELKQLAGLSR